MKRSAYGGPSPDRLVEDLELAPGFVEQRQLETLRQQVEQRPGDGDARLRLARALAQHGDFAGALRQLECCRWLVTDPLVTAGIAFNRGICLEALRRWEEAAEAYEQCVRLLPDLAWGHYQLGRMYLRLGRWNAARQALRRAERLRLPGQAAPRPASGTRSGRVKASSGRTHRPARA